MDAYPTGTVTFLFTDIEGSTALWDRHPEVMGQAMAGHDAIIEASVAASGGMVVRPRGEGDSRFAVFEQAGAAVRAAAAVQRALANSAAGPHPLKVRVGVHTGAADLRLGDYYGSAVNRCARIRGLAHGGQTLLSQATAELVRDELPADATLVNLGTYALRGLNRPETIFQLSLPDLPNDFPPLQSIEVRTGNLPEPPGELIGREQETTEVSQLLTQDAVRLVTLTGPGGTGKTRLSLEIGRALLDQFPHGVYFVDLAPITDPSLVASTIAHTMGIREGGGRPPLDNLKDYLADKRAFLILDNLEQVIRAAPVVAGLLSATQKVRMLATSRIPLQIRGEREYPLDTLEFPRQDAPLSVEQLLEYEAVRFFVRQAQAARPAFRLGPDNAEAIAGICRRLDGLPLAIEIAAARIRMLSPAAILNRLGQSMSLLVGGAVDLPARQQTVRNAIDWSYALLEPDERTLFARLGVFVGGFTLESAEAVCNPDGTLDVFSGVETLLRNSLVRQAEWGEDEPRFEMLLTIRDYALEKLEESGELANTRHAHLKHFAQQAIDQYPRLYGPETLAIMARVEAEYDNFRAALSWGLEPGNDVLSVGWINVFLLWFWYRRGHIEEGREWSERLMRATEKLGGIPHGMGLNIAGMMAMWHGDHDVASRRVAEAVQLAEQGGLEIGISMGHFTYGVNLINQGRDRDAYSHLVMAAERFDQEGNSWDKCNTLIHLANASLGIGDARQAEGWLREALPLAERVGDPWQMAFCLNNFGEVARVQGDYERARGYYERSEALYRQADALGDHARLIHTLGYMALHDGDLKHAEELFHNSLDAFRRLGNKRGMAECLGGLAAVATVRGDAARAAPLLAAADAQIMSSGAAWWPADRGEVERTKRHLRAALGDAEFERLWSEGQGLSLPAAMVRATQDAPPE